MGGGVRRFKRKFQKKKKTESQNILPDEEWDRFMEYMRKDLPASFRISACSSAEAKRLLEIVQSDFFAKLVAPEEGGETPEIKNLLWYPNNMGWQLDLTRKDIRRFESYFRLHNFLMSETATGNISRQETVSMIPPLLLDIQPHHKVIDLCAAPGSKTAQLIETLHGDEAIAPGFVVANDLDNSRCYMLVHQAKRLSSPNCIITNHDASSMPNFMVPDKDGALKVLKYDRVLCDVPCTGDGTLRKNADIWVKWTPGHANNLYGIQNRILKRGLELLEVGGRLVYSTCSLNPVENEAVIFRMLFNAKAFGSFLKTATLEPSSWPCSSKKRLFLGKRSCALATTRNRNPSGPRRRSAVTFAAIVKTLSSFSKETKTFGSRWSESDNLEMQLLRKTCRANPYLFIAWFRDEFYAQEFFELQVLKIFRSFYALEGLDPKCLLTRCLVGKKRHIYMTSPAVKVLVDLNQDKIKIINTGVKVFSRCDNKRMRCEFRLTQEGLFRIEAHIHARRIALPEKDLVTLLENHDPNNPPHITSFTEETQKLCEGVDEGSCVLDHDGTFKISIVGWRGGKSLRAYISKDDAMHYLRLFGVDTSRYGMIVFVH
ncbi:unnamed protein product [Nesidiocoris tenuis]|uniref:tRNA (cytosine(34)-C(5))-methyltransferase n=1 Tax=Nesidiocoris tenuis TaxID=355587 RepID=A0A6H5H4T8_9HEMI|nr:unnamed protein product [Nesidiocoris tenuis]